MRQQVQSLKDIIRISHERVALHEKIGLITGSFDIIHPGHVHFLREAKRQCDLLVVGIENDINIKRAKGESRPIHTQDQRIDVLAELRSVDYIFKIEEEFPIFNEEAEKYYAQLLHDLHPTYLFTTIDKDAYFERKKTKAEQADVVLIGINVAHDMSTTDLANKILKEF